MRKKIMMCASVCTIALAGESLAGFVSIVSDNSWKAASGQVVWCPGVVGGKGPNWTAVGFNDRTWGVAVAPWSPFTVPINSAIPGSTGAGAKWMWMAGRTASSTSS